MPNDPKNPPSPHDHDDIALPDTSDRLPPLDFTTFILSLSTSVLASLGEIPGPEGHVSTDLSLARQTIDIIGMLREKTHGNLSGEEERLLDQVLLDLRMKFVSAAGGQKQR